MSSPLREVPSLPHFLSLLLYSRPSFLKRSDDGAGWILSTRSCPSTFLPLVIRCILFAPDPLWCFLSTSFVVSFCYFPLLDPKTSLLDPPLRPAEFQPDLRRWVYCKFTAESELEKKLENRSSSGYVTGKSDAFLNYWPYGPFIAPSCRLTVSLNLRATSVCSSTHGFDDEYLSALSKVGMVYRSAVNRPRLHGDCSQSCKWCFMNVWRPVSVWKKEQSTRLVSVYRIVSYHATFAWEQLQANL